MREIPADSLLSDQSFIAFDVETTGLSPVANRLVELSGVKFKIGTDEGPDQLDTFSTLIDPEVPIPEQVTGIHGITDAMVKGAPKASEAIRNFMDWAGKDVIFMAHNAPFDVEFLRVGLTRAGLVCPAEPVVDTLILARDLLETPNHKLQTIVEFLGLSTGGYHRALADSVHVKEVFRSMSLRFTLDRWEKLLIYGCVSPFAQDIRPEDLAGLVSPQVMEHVSILEGVIKTNGLVKMVYNGSFRSTRTVQPLNLVLSRGNYYLNAFCPYVQAERTFRVDKIDRLSSRAT